MNQTDPETTEPAEPDKYAKARQLLQLATANHPTITFHNPGGN